MNVEFERCIDLIVQYIEKYGDKFLETIENDIKVKEIE